MGSKYTKVITKNEFLDRLEEGRWNLEVPAPFTIKNHHGGSLRIGLEPEGFPSTTIYDTIHLNKSKWRQFDVHVPEEGEALVAALRALAEVNKLRMSLKPLPGSDMDDLLGEMAALAVDQHVVLRRAYVVLDV